MSEAHSSTLVIQTPALSVCLALEQPALVMSSSSCCLLLYCFGKPGLQ